MRILVGVASRAAKRAFARQLNRERGSPTGQNVGPSLQNFRASQQRLPLAWKPKPRWAINIGCYRWEKGDARSSQDVLSNCSSRVRGKNGKPRRAVRA